MTDPKVVDVTPGAERRRRFQIAHLLVERSTEHMAEDLGRPQRTIQRWVQLGVGWQEAELVAIVLLNEHPSYLFGPEWEAEAYAGVDTADVLFEEVW